MLQEHDAKRRQRQVERLEAAVRGDRHAVDPAQVARPDWNNELTSLLLDIDQEISKAADAKSKAVVIRRLKRALAGEPPDNTRRRPPISGTSRRSRAYDDN